MADEFDPELLAKYREAAKEGVGITAPVSPIDARQEKLRGMPLSQETVEGMARAVIPMAVQTAAEFTPIGRTARFGQAVAKAVPFLRDVGGGLLGYEANVALGLEEQSPREAIKSVAIPAAARGVASTVKGITTHLPGTPVIKQGLAVEKLIKSPPVYIPLGPQQSDKLYQEVVQRGNPLIPAKEMEKEVDAVITELTNITNPVLAKDVAETLQLANGFKDRIMDLRGVGGIPFQEYWANLKGLSGRLDSLQRTGGAEFRHTARIKAAGQRDLASAGDLKGKGYPELKAANKLYRREQAQNELSTVVQQQGFSHKQTPQGEFIEVAPSRMLNWIKHPDQKFWRESLEPQELKEVETFLHNLSKAPRIGSGDWMSAVGAGGTAGVLAYRATNDPLLAGAATAAAVTLPALISRAVLTPSGRWLLTGLIQDTGRHIPTNALPIMATALRAHLDRDPLDALARENQVRMPQEQ